MATDVLFPFYEVLVNTIFGSIALSIMGIGVILILMLALCRTSWVFILYWMFFYFITMGVMYVGGIALLLGFILATMYVVTELTRLFFADR